MEDQLNARDKVGIQDMVLLENHTDIDKFVENLKKRYQESIIYTYIGSVCISINPYKKLIIYNDDYIKKYKNVNLFELPPHIFAIADSAYRNMLEENLDQCILISGESGSGKTEASKHILQYISKISGESEVKERLISSIPLLEALGNARTVKNDNSSRFAKYMDLIFDFKGNVIGGHVFNYLLEKSRVVNQSKGERNFHIFYQFLIRGKEKHLRFFDLKRDPYCYYYLSQGSNEVDDINDANNFLKFMDSLQLLNFSEEDTTNFFAIIASLLHMGNTGFFEEDGQSILSSNKTLLHISRILGCGDLKKDFTTRSIVVKGEVLCSPLTRDEACCARDGAAKAIYQRLFDWIVSLIGVGESKGRIFGLVDIYGFEVCEINRFDQLCINYCNEKLQQLFIELTLKSEQEEYLLEKIEWNTVEYFDNQIICDLFEEKHKGIFSILDEECLRPGDATDITFLTKFEQVIGPNEHFLTYNLVNNKLKKQIDRNQFIINHYAGPVKYDVDGFLEKNNDPLYRDLLHSLSQCTNSIMTKLFPVKASNGYKRPPTIVTQFGQSMNGLMSIIKNKVPWYIRCIKPNSNKKPIWENDLVKFQVEYLGLMQNLDVRRKGFAYRRAYPIFIKRYKCLCPKTWPNPLNNDPKQSTLYILESLNLPPHEYCLGVSKVFIRHPRTLFLIEDKFQAAKYLLAIKIQTIWRGYHARRVWNMIKSTISGLQRNGRGFLARKERKMKENAGKFITNFIKAYLTNDKQFIQFIRKKWLLKLSTELPKNLLDKTWPNTPLVCQEASELLKQLHKKNLVLKYIKEINEDRKKLLNEKVVAEQIFKEKKENYLSSVPILFRNNRLTEDTPLLENLKAKNESLIYSLCVIKYDRHGYKSRNRILIASNEALYIYDGIKPKHRINWNNLNLVVTNLSDGLLIVKILDAKNDKGDLILDCKEYLIEFITKVSVELGIKDKVLIDSSGKIEHHLNNGKSGVIMFSKGIKRDFFKRKDGILQVVGIVKEDKENDI